MAQRLLRKRGELIKRRFAQSPRYPRNETNAFTRTLSLLYRDCSSLIGVFKLTLILRTLLGILVCLASCENRQHLLNLLSASYSGSEAFLHTCAPPSFLSLYHSKFKRASCNWPPSQV